MWFSISVDAITTAVASKECMLHVIKNGTPLPKGHGDLVDYREMKNIAREYGAYTEAALSHVKPKTIIEADRM